MAGSPAGASARTWAGTWVAERLGVRLTHGARPVGVGLSDLVGLAVRRNPRRAHLLVSAVLGKHVPTDPRLVYGAGLLLGDLVRARLCGVDESSRAGSSLADALGDAPGAAAALRNVLCEPQDPLDAIVFGYAETATALGHSVADALGGAYYLHSTRRPVPGFTTYGGFEEEHSHATSHLLLPSDPASLDRDVPVVLVDDELSTGRTVLNTIEALHAVRPRRHYVLAALVDLRGDEDRARMDALAARLGARIDAVALAGGRVELPDGILDAGQALVASIEASTTEVAADTAVGSTNDRAVDAAGGSTSSTAGDATADTADDMYPVTRVHLDWPSGLPDGGRHGFLPSHRARLEKDLPRMAGTIGDGLGDGFSRVLVLGFEELMYAPLRIAEALADVLHGADVRYSTTTRSPVLPVDDPGYAIRTRLAFPAHDDPADGPGERYAYNVSSDFDRIVFVVDDKGDTDGLTSGLLARLRALAPVTIATVPSHRREA